MVEKFFLVLINPELTKNIQNVGVRDGNLPDELPTCNCLPSCTSLMYDAEISYGDIGFKNYHRTKTYFASGTKQWVFSATTRRLHINELSV